MGNLLVYKNRIPSGTSSTIPDWTRPSDWLAMPTIGTQEFIGLLAITDDESNHIALLCRGAYTVDWGDGVTENVADNVKAQHTYTYSSISGTPTTRGYKQVLVRVTPQAGQNITVINLQQQNSILAKAHTVGWLDIAIKGSNITSLVLGGDTVYQGICENVDIYSMGNVTSFSALFHNFYSLQKLTLPSTSTVNILWRSFLGCYSLKSIPLFNTANVTDFTQSFASCTSLITMPLLDFSKGTNFDGTFSNCYRMQYYPLFNTSKGNYFGFMFSNNNSLQRLPNLSTVLGTNFSTMLGSCNSLAKGAFQGTRYSISYANMCLSRNAVIDIFNGLGTAVGTPTITITTNPAFSAMPVNSSIPVYLWGLTVVPSTQDVYASAQNSYIYKQTGGVGPFVIDNNVSSPWYRSMGVDIYDNVYCASGQFTSLLKKIAGSSSWVSISTTGASGNGSHVAGDFLGNLYYGTSAGLFKQTALTGSFVQVYTGAIDSFDISPFDGSIYIVSGGIIYKQTAATGSFNSVQTLAGSYVVCMPNGDAYAANGTLYKQTAGTGSFVSMGILTNVGSNNTRQIVDKSDGTLLISQYGGDIFSLNFDQVVTPTDRLIAINKGWTIA